MEPTNQPARSTAINKFLGLYGISLLLVMIAVYFLFNTPASIFKSEVQMYITSEAEEGQFLNRIDGLTSNLKNIAQGDLSYQSSTNEIEKGTLQSNLQQYQRTIVDGLVDIKNDTAKYVSWLTRRDAYNYTTLFNSIVAYRSTISSLQKSLLEKGGDATELLKTRGLLEDCNRQLEIYKAMAANKPSMPAVMPVPSSGGGGSSAKEAQLTQQLEKAQAELAICQKEKGIKATVPTQTPPVTGFDEGKKAAVLFDLGLELYNKAEATRNLYEKRGILSAAKLIIEKSKPAYPDADKLNRSINQIEVELNKLHNMG